MVKRIRTIYPCGLNKGFSSKFSVRSKVRHEIPGHIGQNVNKDEDNRLNTLSDKNYQASSQKFR